MTKRILQNLIRISVTRFIIPNYHRALAKVNNISDIGGDFSPLFQPSG